MTMAQNLIQLPHLASLFSFCQGPGSTRFLFIVRLKKCSLQKPLAQTAAGLTDPCGADVGHGWSLCGWGSSKHGQRVSPIQQGAKWVRGGWRRRGWRGGATSAGSTSGLRISDLKEKAMWKISDERLMKFAGETERSRSPVKKLKKVAKWKLEDLEKKKPPSIVF